MKKIVVTGAGGFIGHHLAKALAAEGHRVRGVDIKYPEFERTWADEFQLRDLRLPGDCVQALYGADEVYALAASMGGMGYITTHDADILRDNLLIDVNTLEAARGLHVKKIIYTSSACVYPNYRQEITDIEGLREYEAYPADPQHGYGWEKLTAEKILTAYAQEALIDVRIARLHAIYGPLGTWRGGREKAPAALCRKVAEAQDGGTIDIWGDGLQTRSFCYIDDCVEGLIRLARSGFCQPLNIGSTEQVTIGHLADLVADAAGKRVMKKYVDGPEGVRGRSSDNTATRQVLGWEPSVPLREGIARTYPWVESQVLTAEWLTP